MFSEHVKFRMLGQGCPGNQSKPRSLAPLETARLVSVFVRRAGGRASAWQHSVARVQEVHAVVCSCFSNRPSASDMLNSSGQAPRLLKPTLYAGKSWHSVLAQTNRPVNLPSVAISACGLWLIFLTLIDLIDPRIRGLCFRWWCQFGLHTSVGSAQAQSL